MRPRLVTNTVCARECLPVIIIACLVIRGCIFGFLVILRVKGVLFSIVNCIFWLDFFHALFLYFGLLVG